MGNEFDILEDFILILLSIPLASSKENLVFLLLAGDYLQIQWEWGIITFVLNLVKVGFFRSIERSEKPHGKAHILMCFIVAGLVAG